MADESAGELKPRPDPTTLTTEALMREVEAIRRDLSSQREFILGEIGHVKELKVTQFKAVAQQFEAVAMRTAEQKSDTGKALEAALASARELVQLQTEAFTMAITRVEAQTTKLIDGLSMRVDNLGSQLDDKINDLKDRFNKGEGTKQGGTDQSAAIRANATLAVSILVGAALIAFGLIAALRGGG